MQDVLAMAGPISTLNPDGFDDLEAWLQKTRSAWSRRLDALERELRA